MLIVPHLGCNYVRGDNYEQSRIYQGAVEPKLKITAEHVLSELGITPTQAITILYTRIAREPH